MDVGHQNLSALPDVPLFHARHPPEYQGFFLSRNYHSGTEVSFAEAGPCAIRLPYAILSSITNTGQLQVVYLLRMMTR